MPSNVLPSIIVDRYLDIHEDQVWQFGARLIPRKLPYDADAFLQANETERTLTVHIKGPHARDYLAVLIARVESAIAEMPVGNVAEVELTADMRINRDGSPEPGLARGGSQWASYAQVVEFLAEDTMRFPGPKGGWYDLSKLTGRLPQHKALAAMQLAMEALAGNVELAKRDPALDKAMAELRAVLTGKDAADPAQRQAAVKAVKTFSDRFKEKLERIADVKDAAEAVGTLRKAAEWIAQNWPGGGG